MRIAKIVAGFTMLAVGVAGLILPIMPGWIFVIPGLVMLGREYHWARRLLDRIKKFHPNRSREA